VNVLHIDSSDIMIPIAYTRGRPPSSVGGCQWSTALFFLTSDTSSGPAGLAGTPARHEEQFTLKTKTLHYTSRLNSVSNLTHLVKLRITFLQSSQPIDCRFLNVPHHNISNVKMALHYITLQRSIMHCCTTVVVLGCKRSISSRWVEEISSRFQQ